MIRILVVFIVGLIAIWVGLCVPAFVVAGRIGVFGSAVAAAICAVPAVGTLAFSLWASHKSSDWQLTALVGGMLGRMGFALGVGIAVHHGFEDFTLRNFLIWLIVYYLASLLLEIGVVVRTLSQNKSNYGS